MFPKEPQEEIDPGNATSKEYLFILASDTVGFAVTCCLKSQTTFPTF